jgi:hypothetical protein
MEILRAVREADEDEIMNARRITLSVEVEALFNTYQQAAVTAMDGKTLKDLVLNVDKTTISQVNAQHQIG